MLPPLQSARSTLRLSPLWLLLGLGPALALPLPLLAQADGGMPSSTPAAGAEAGDHAARAPRVQAAQRTAPVSIDAELGEAAWQAAPAATDFRQQEPHEGEPAAQRTEIRFLYDDEALYIGARMYDSLGAAGIRSRLARRDQEVEGDNIMFVFDTFHDHTGRTMFRVTPAGAKFDAGQAAANADPSWDPVWQAATRVDSLGWTAELRIPLSQLRFPRDSTQTWGLQVWRYVERLNEISMWSFWRRNEPGGPSRFGHLEGLHLAGKRRGLELLPYLVARGDFLQPRQPGSPFEKPSAYGARLGGDLKVLLTSTITLDATFNPDFGQVEVDPAVVNLSAFETFFPERRPFFVEGSGLFGFGGFNCYFCSNVQSLSLFYSRRIGRLPQGFVTSPAKYAHSPESTTILGAAKVTGRTAGGYQIGVLDALTSAEQAEAVDAAGADYQQEVEPLTNYLVARVQRNLRQGNLTLGGIATSVARRFGHQPLADLVPRHAEALGFDGRMFWKNRSYSLMWSMAASEVAGEPAAILRLQRSSARYFQRPDRQHGGNGVFSDGYDAAATSLRGYAAYARAAKESGNVLWESAVNLRSPGFEVNDLAFLTRADYVWMNTNLGRQWTQPTSWYRRADLMLGAQQQYNFDGDLTDRQFHGWAGSQLANYWWINGMAIHRPETFDDRLTRGGPVVRRAANWFVAANLNTDWRKPVVLGFFPSYGWNAEGSHSSNLGMEVRLKPTSSFAVSLGPSFSRSGSTAQFVRRFDDGNASHFYSQRIVFADLVQRTLAMDTRLSATFSPTLTLEVFLQPFVASADYRNFKEFAAPRRLAKNRYDAAQLRAISSAEGRDSAYVLDPDRDPATRNFSFANPDFNFRSLRGNAVLRWEYRPGSTLYLVWQQERSGSEPLGDFDFSRDAAAVFREKPNNIFLIKASYWSGK